MNNIYFQLYSYLFQETIEITMTKTALEVLTSLGKAFNEAISTEIPLSKRSEAAPYIVQNNLGFDITVMISNTPFKVRIKSINNYAINIFIF